MLTRIRINIKYILSKFTIIASTIFGVVSILQIFFEWETVGIKNNDLKSKIIVLSVIMTICIVIATVWGII